MKKRIFKIGGGILCTVIVIFLLLPFLETEGISSKSTTKTFPQVSSENPLAKLVKRLAPLFGSKERRQALLPAQADPQQAPAWQALYLQPTSSSQELQNNEIAFTAPVNVPPTQEPFDYADASFQTDQGEWVLVKQTAPQSSTPGMHEINVHENPFDRYLKHERARHVQPATPAQAIPDSKWARFTKPLHYLFSGNETPRPVSTSSVQIYREGSSLPNTSANHEKTTNTTGQIKNSSYGQIQVPLPNSSPLQWAQLTPKEREQITERHAAHEFSQLLSGERIAEDAAETLANAKYPNPQNKQEQQEKEEYKKRMSEESKQQIREGLLANIQANALGKEEMDELGYMTGCKDTSLPADTSACSPDKEQTPTHTPQEKLQAQQLQNAQTFFEQTNYILPQGLPFTVVLGPTHAENLQYMAANPTTQQTGEMYQFMYEQQHCSERPCYWVPNLQQEDPQLAEALFTVNNAHLKTDPLHTYNAYVESFLQHKAKQAGENISPEEWEQWKKEVQQNRPNWVPYTEDQLKQMHENTKKALASSETDLSAPEPVFPFVTDPAVAPQVAQLIGPASFVYNNISLVNSTTALEAGAQMTESLVQNVNNAKEVFNQVTKGAINEGVRAQINQQISNQNKSGGGFAGLLNFFKTTPQK